MGRQGEQTGSTCGCPSVIHPLLEQSITFNAFVATASGENPKKNKSERGEDDKKRRMRRRKRERETAIMKGGELRESDRVKSEKRARGNACEDDCGGIRGGRECLVSCQDLVSTGLKTASSFCSRIHHIPTRKTILVKAPSPPP